MSAARTLLAHHPEVFQRQAEAGAGAGLLSMVVSLVASAVSHKRSALQTNGLRCMAELFRCVFVVGT